LIKNNMTVTKGNLVARIKNFQKFSKQDVLVAISELKKIKKDENRKHLQRLVYANLVDRFDILVDELMLELAVLEDNDFHNRVLEKVSNINVSKKDYFETFLAEEPKLVIENQIKDVVRGEFLRTRHSQKLRTLLQDGFNVSKLDLDKSRVNANDGRIQTTFSRRAKTIPSSIIGYSDYLYAKRSGIVHGTGKSISKNDAAHLVKNFSANTNIIGIKIGSIASAIQFYSHLTDYMLTSNWPPSRNHKN